MKNKNWEHKRRQYFIQRSFQLRFIFTFLLVALIASVAFSFGFYFLVAKDISANFNKAHMELRNTWELFFPTLIVIGTSTFVISSAVASFVMIRFSHKIAGPLYKLQQIANNISNGKLYAGVRLREKDQIVPLAGSIDTMVKGLSSRIMEINENVMNMNNITDSLVQLKDKGHNGELDESILKLQMVQQSLNSAVNTFDCSGLTKPDN